MVRPEVKKKRWEKAAQAIQSRKAQKKLEKVVLRKKGKVDRAKLLKDLKQCQLDSSQLELLHSTSSMQTRGLKRFTKDENSRKPQKFNEIERAEKCLDAALLLKRKRVRVRTHSDSSKSISSEDTDAISTDEEPDTIEDSNNSPDVQQGSEDLNANECSHPEHDLKLDVSNGEQESHSTRELVRDIVSSEIKFEEEVKPIVRNPAIYVEVTRDPKIQESRLALPIIGEEQHIMETIRYNDIVVLSGETGSGKTTQLPQFLYESGFTLDGKLIAITEPRRVAAISMSERVAKELNLTSDYVSYQIRFFGNATDKTVIKFLTDGVLLKECQQDFLLSKYSVIIIDEAHERSVFSDILIGLLSRIVPMRRKQGNPLKLIIMSATLRVKDFTENNFLFKVSPPLINIESRQYPVTAHFAKKTPINYLTAASKKVKSIHSKMPKGGILVFVTSQMDVRVLCKKLSSQSLHCVGLYAMLPMEKQKRVFEDPPEGKRLCVIATNVAETSITIPNIKYVVDTGMEKTKVYNMTTGVSRFVVSWTSKSSAEQRKGRAGRMGPGHCYRLYSSAVFSNDFPEFSEPQILRRPVEDLILQMKSMNIDNVVNFPFPTRPSLEALTSAEKKLILLGALDDSKIKNARFSELKKLEFASRLTPIGKSMSNYPVSARCSKMIVLSPSDLIHHVLALVCAMTVREMFLDSGKIRDLRKKWAGHGSCKLLGDFMIMISAICKADSSGCSNKDCKENGLRTKAMLEIHKLRKQLLDETKKHHSIPLEGLDKKLRLRKPTESQASILRQLLLSSHCDNVARKLPDGDIIEKDPKDPNKTIKKKLKGAYECMGSESHVYICPESVLKNDHPDYVIYKELYQGEKKMYMRDIAAIEPEWLPHYAFKLCNVSDNTNKSDELPYYDSTLDQIICTRQVSYGPMNWPLGNVNVPMHLLDTGIEIFKSFAAFLIAGDVISWFKKYTDRLLSPPSIMTKPWSKLQPRTSKLLHALVSRNIKSRRELIKEWKDDVNCKYAIIYR